MDVEVAVTLLVVGACLVIATIAGLVELFRRRRERWLIVSAQVTAVKRHRAQDLAGSECPSPTPPSPRLPGGRAS